MAKKKVSEVVYTPISQTVPQLVDKSINTIPNYEDSGVKFQGKYKTQQTGDKYELRTQSQRGYNFAIQGPGVAGDIVTVSRPYNNLRFFSKQILVQWNNSATTFSDYFILGDIKNGVFTNKLYIFTPTAAGSVMINLDDHPRMFEGDTLGIKANNAVAANFWIFFGIYGWEQEF
jgi:hypothetical protein